MDTAIKVLKFVGLAYALMFALTIGLTLLSSFMRLLT